MKISIVMCTRNRLKELVRFTESLFSQTELPDEYIIVDSSDQRIDKEVVFKEKILNSSSIDVKYIHSKPGLTYQRNLGVENTSGDIIYFFDDDIILEKNFFEIINRTFVEYPEYMGVMGTYKEIDKPNIKGKIVLGIKSFFMLQRDFGNGKFNPSGFPNHPYGKEEISETEVLAGGLTAYRKIVFEKFSFDESLTGYSYMEDVDFSRRVSYQYKLCFNPNAKCEHRHAGEGRQSLRDGSRMYMVNHRYFFMKNFTKRDRGNVWAHYWSILGLIVFPLIYRRPEQLMGYLDGLVEFYCNKKRYKNFSESNSEQSH